jgi:hypothetical protein
MLEERASNPAGWAERRSAAMREASRFSWAVYADACAAVYRELASIR